MDGAQRLYLSSINPDPADELAFRTKDAMWFLARQWQSGEFEAENGGKPASVHVNKRDHPLTELDRGSGFETIDRAAPLESLVEGEDKDGAASAWDSEALEYRFEVKTPDHTLVASDYHGRDLDWWHFALAKSRQRRSTPADDVRMAPANISFKGAPHPRWWRFEDSEGFFDSPFDPEPNVLSVILPEFFYSDVENWYVLPLPLKAGTLREVEKVQIVDSFGVVETLDPANNGSEKHDWRLFSLDDSDGKDTTLDGRFLLAPHIARQVLDNDTIEDVRFIRDEQANMLWAVEQRYTDKNGVVVDHGDQERLRRPLPTLDRPADTEGRFMLQSETPPHWVPYVPRYEKKSQGAPSGEIRLRRGRTVEDIKTQAEAQVTRDSTYLNEEEFGDATVRVRRIHRYCRGSDGKEYFWIGRCRDTTSRLTSGSNFKTDFIAK